MPQIWSKQYTTILQSKIEDWKNTETYSQKEVIIAEVADAIKSQIASRHNEDPTPLDLNRVKF